MTLLNLLLGFSAGLSLGAVLSWRDNGYKGRSGLAWMVLLIINLELAIASIILGK